MSKAIYRLVNEDISDVVSTEHELMDKFRHRLPKGTEICGYDHVQLNKVQIPRRIEVLYRGKINLPKNKLNGLYRLVN